MMQKRRFGVSVPLKLADELDLLSSKLNVDRSSLVSEALETYVHDKLSMFTSHRCRGVMMIVSPRKKSKLLAPLYEHYGGIIRDILHSHVDGLCIEVIIVEGSGEEIMRFESEIKQIKDIQARYAPLMWVREE